MKKIISIALLIISFTALFADKGIVVTQKFSSTDFPKASITVTWYVTETQCKMKMDFRDDKVNTTTWFIPDVANGALSSYLEGGASKIYFSLPASGARPSEMTQVFRVNLEKTGETQSVSGMNCEKMLVKTNRNTTEMWVTTDFQPAYYKFAPFFQSSMELLGLSNNNTPGFPLSSVTKDLSGKVISSSELVSVTQTDLNAADFTVPAGYQLAK
jgi:hypothetical protein